MNLNSTDSFQSESQLLARARDLAGLTVKQLALRVGVELPKDLRTLKGWVGQLLEMNLGATAGSQPLPDFPELGIELKTLPIDHRGQPKESTYVSIVPLRALDALTWENSELRAKLMRILWIPVEAESSIPLPLRRIGMPVFWQINPQEEAVLRQDWQELMDMVALGELEKITARLGTWLQIRPKGANAKSLAWGTSATGEKIATLPRGFYLRPAFTARILKGFLYP